jgi:hypothetical protein
MAPVVDPPSSVVDDEGPVDVAGPALDVPLDDEPEPVAVVSVSGSHAGGIDPAPPHPVAAKTKIDRRHPRIRPPNCPRQPPGP